MTAETQSWAPKLSLQRCTDLLCKTPGSPYEMEHKLIDGRMQRVYKNLPQSLRHFWLMISQVYADREYIVYDSPTSSSGDRITYGQLAYNAQVAASVFRKKYKVRKGDRVGIVSRNNPEWVVAWWACQLLGAVAVAINAWLPAHGNPSPLKHCIQHTQCKLLILDAERAEKLQHWICEMSAGFDNKLNGVLVVRHQEVDQRELRKDIWKSMHKWDQVMGEYKGSPEEWKKEPECLPEDPCSIFFTSGTVPYMIMDLEDGGLSDSSRKPIVGVSFGGAPAPVSMLADLERKFPGALIGLPCPVNDLLIVDEHTLTVLSPGKIGEIWIRGPNVLKCYWKDEEATNKALTKDGWFRSGDLGYVDEEGFLYIKDRLKDVIIRGGENIDSTTVENAFYDDERVHDCAAVGVPDRKLGELVALAVVLKDASKKNVTEPQLLERAKDRLPQFSLPVIILEMDDIPRNAAGKTDKRALRKILKKEWEKKKDRIRVPKSRL
ncbi:hypothetical protein FS837_001942 [Tulasnella sp. UAMH 9824]|nr:hypothetical protein FS837_001942 [Tulasnella sp. UAMH 9824]